MVYMGVVGHKEISYDGERGAGAYKRGNILDCTLDVHHGKEIRSTAINEKIFQIWSWNILSGGHLNVAGSICIRLKCKSQPTEHHHSIYNLDI